MSDSPEQKPAPPAPAPPKSNPVWVAAIVGGLLGGLLAFGVARACPATPKPAPEPAQSEARHYADDLIALLKAGKNDDFFAGVRQAFSGANQEQLGGLRKELQRLRDQPAEAYGPSLDFEFIR